MGAHGKQLNRRSKPIFPACRHKLNCMKITLVAPAQVMTVVDRSHIEAVAPPPEFIVKEYTLPLPSASIMAVLGEHQPVPGSDLIEFVKRYTLAPPSASIMAALGEH